MIVHGYAGQAVITKNVVDHDIPCIGGAGERREDADACACTGNLIAVMC